MRKRKFQETVRRLEMRLWGKTGSGQSEVARMWIRSGCRLRKGGERSRRR